MKAVITMAVTALPEDLQRYWGKDLDSEIKVHREKRSLSANAYFYVLVSKIAEALKRSETYVHNKLIADYGQYELQDLPEADGTIRTHSVFVILRDDVDAMELKGIHLQETSATKVLDDGNLYRVYRVMRGSHTYNTKEMAFLIDMTVQEAKDLGIETLTPDQLRQMKADMEKYDKADRSA